MKNVLKKDANGNFKKRGTKDPASVLERMEWRYPWIMKKMESIEEIAVNEFLIRTIDGQYRLYFDYDETMHKVILFNDVMELSEQDWRLGFARCLQRQMRRRGMPNYRLVDKLGISPTTLTNYLYARSTPPTYVVQKIARLLNCSVDDLCPKEYILLD